MMMFTGDAVSGKQAEKIGLVAKAVPEDRLEAEVNTLAERIALVPRELLELNKAAINKVAEEMGLRQALDFGLKLDTLSHTTVSVQNFRKMSEEQGLKAALAANEAPFKKAPKPFQD
jgi:enoyl-CoA hydratase